MQKVQLENVMIQNVQMNKKSFAPSNEQSSFLKELQKNTDETFSKKIQESDQKISEKSKSKKSAEEVEKEDSLEEEKISKVQSKNEVNENLLLHENATQKKEKLVLNGEILSQNENFVQVKTENLTQNQLEWLSETEIKTGKKSILDEKFENLIENAEKFGEINISDKELLENSQNISTSDPKLFLSQIESSNEIKIPPEGNNQLPIENENLSNDESLIAFEKNILPEIDKKGSKIEVHDLRTEKSFRIQEEKVETITENAVQKNKKSLETELSFKQDSNNSFEAELNLSDSITQNITSSNQIAASTNSTFQNMLSNAVVQNAPEFVKAGNIILKDNNQGNINLIVHPEKLGNVKIELSLSEKVISASITVHSKEAFEAVKESLATLKNAFTQSGFETGEFNLNFSQNSFAQSEGNQSNQNAQASFLAEKSYESYSINSENVVVDGNSEFNEYKDYSLNIVA